MSTGVLLVEFEWPDDRRTVAELNALIRECVDPLRRENVALYGWRVAMGEREDD